MSGRAVVKSLQIGNVTVNVDNTEGKSLKQVAEEVGLRFEGTTWIVNGERLSEAEASTARVREGDEVKANTKGDGGHEG